MTIEEAIEWMQEEKGSFERAPDINGCPMTKCWQKAIDVYDMAISALRRQDHFREVTKKVEPLTMDELRRMEGQPVYIVENTEYWAIVNSFDQAGVYLLSYGNPDDYGYFGLYGKTWLAYRQKPEEDDHDERKENENV